MFTILKVKARQDMKGSFSGYERPDGRVGIRNHVLILPTSVCASDVARMIAEQLEASEVCASL